MVSAFKLYKEYEGEPILEDVTLEFYPKESVAITGVSGSGKSTLLHILSTFLPPTSGTIKLFNKEIYSLSDEEILDIRRNKIGVIFQDHYLFRGFSTKENLQISSMLTGGKIDYEILELFKIENTLNKQITELSGGQKQRVSIARVLQKRPKIIFADEPTGNLDKKNALNVMNALFEYVKIDSATLIFATHDMELAKMCDRIYKIEHKSAKRWSL